MAWYREVKVTTLEADVLLKQKVILSREGLLDPILKTNLDFAMGAVDAIPSVMKRNAKVQVEGQQQLLIFIAGHPQLHLLVFHDHEGPKLQQKITKNSALSAGDINKAYFAGHSCPQDVSCMEQAINTLRFPNEVELKIICKELRVTFTTAEPAYTIVVP